jgi:hypothetical protein
MKLAVRVCCAVLALACIVGQGIIGVLSHLYQWLES